jgi:hypothetical protein
MLKWLHRHINESSIITDNIRLVSLLFFDILGLEGSNQGTEAICQDGGLKPEADLAQHF